MTQGGDLYRIWVYLSQTPLLWLTATLMAFAIGDAVSARCGRHPLANPVVIAAALLIAVLTGTGTSYADLLRRRAVRPLPARPGHGGARPAALAQPRRGAPQPLPMLAALFAGSLTAIGSAVAIAWALGAPREILASLAAKSVTAPIAMALTQTIGGIPALAAVLVVLTGILGSVIVTPLMNAMGIRDFAARGFAAGVASHGIGTARAFQVSEEAGTFAGIAMGLNGALTALIFLVLGLML